MLQTSYNLQVQWVSTASNFSSQLRYLQLQTKLTATLENYLHAIDIRRPTFASSSTEVFIEEMRRWDVKSDLQAKLIQLKLLSLTYLITNRSSRAFEHYLQVEVSSTSIFQSSATNIVSSSTEVFIEEMRRWDERKYL